MAAEGVDTGRLLSNEELLQGEPQRAAASSKGRPRRASSLIRVVVPDGEEERETWGNKAEFILTTVGYAVGVGNVWRFPYLVYENGGGSFLIPYFLALFFLGMPMFFLELAVGQYFKKGVYHSLGMIHPALKGVGLAACVISVGTALYYNVLIAWSIFFFFRSFTNPLPWKGNAESFWFDTVLQHGDNAYVAEGMNWPMVGCLTAAWIFIYFCIRKGIKTSGKVVYVTATFPYVFLVILFFRGVTLPGAGEGIRFYLKPDFSDLAKPKVWALAASQIFYSLGPGFGGLIAFGSYNPSDNNVVKDSYLVPVINSGTSFFAGFAIFSLLGHLASVKNIPVDQVVKQGTGLAFIVYPEGLALLPVPYLFSICFFLMLFCLGVDSQFAMVEVFMTLLKDMRLVNTDEDEPLSPKSFTPEKLKKGIPQPALAGIVCGAGWLIGIGFFTNTAGIDWFDFFNFWVGTFGLMPICLCEAVAVGWLYGGQRFLDELAKMIGRDRIHPYWAFAWRYSVPFFLFVLFWMGFIDTALHPPEGPVVVNVLGFLVGLTPIGIMAIFAWVELRRNPHTKTEPDDLAPLTLDADEKL